MAKVKKMMMEQLDDRKTDKYSILLENLSDEYDDLLDAINSLNFEKYEDHWSVAGKQKIEIFKTNIAAIQELLGIQVSQSTSKNLLVMLHSHVVAAVEAYLSSTFIETALSTKQHMKSLVETDPVFAKRKFSIKEIFTKQESLQNDLKQYLKELLFHDIAKIKPLYASVLKIDFGTVDWLFKAVSLRHDCVHRAGYDKDGKAINLTTATIKELIDKANIFVDMVESKLPNIPDEHLIF